LELLATAASRNPNDVSIQTRYATALAPPTMFSLATIWGWRWRWKDRPARPFRSCRLCCGRIPDPGGFRSNLALAFAASGDRGQAMATLSPLMDAHAAETVVASYQRIGRVGPDAVGQTAMHPPAPTVTAADPQPSQPPARGPTPSTAAAVNVAAIRRDVPLTPELTKHDGSAEAAPARVVSSDATLILH
jgi:hypothetical protein